MPERVVLEVARKKAFASALDWPGWSRSGRTADDALQALLDHGARYAAVTARAGLPFTAPTEAGQVQIIERLRGGGTTEFGAPGEPAAAEDAPISTHDLERLVALLEAAWATFDTAAAGAHGVELATGPRGGGRDLARIVEHVREAEVAYLHKLCARAPAPADETAGAPMALLRRAFTDALRAAATGATPPDPSRTRKPWPPRYAVRRAAWHVLDHAWEIEDRSA